MGGCAGKNKSKSDSNKKPEKSTINNIVFFLKFIYMVVILDDRVKSKPQEVFIFEIK